MDIYIQITFRVIAIMILFLICTLLSGRRHLSELPVFDFLVIMVLGSVIGADITEPDIPHMPIAYAVVLITLIQFIYGKVVIKNRKIGKLLTFEPIVIIQNGEFIKSNLSKINYSIDTVLALLREKSIFYLNEVDFAIIESSGDISVLKKQLYQSSTKQDLNINSTYKGLPLSVVIEGTVCNKNLTKLNLDLNWLKNELNKQNIENISDVFYACIDNSNTLYATTNSIQVSKRNEIQH